MLGVCVTVATVVEESDVNFDAVNASVARSVGRVV